MRYLLLFLLMSTSAWGAGQQTFPLCSSMVATGVSTAIAIPPGAKTFQASAHIANGNAAFAVTVQGSLDGVWFDDLATMAATQAASDSVTMTTPAYKFYRCNVTSITATASGNVVGGY